MALSPINPASPEASVPFFSPAKEPPRKLGFLIDGCNIQDWNYLNKRPHLLEGKYIAEHNKGVAFDCMHVFDPLHLSSFFCQFPETLHKRIALYLIRIFANSANVDDLIETFLKPAIQAMIDSGQVYYERPGWLNELSSESILDTLASIQKELGGYENLQAEFSLIKRKLLRSSNEISSNAFKKYLEENPDITEVYGFIGQVSLYFLDEHSTITRFADDQRHLIFKLGNREVPVHLFGTDDTAAYRDAMRLFALEHGLKIPYDHEEEIYCKQDEPITGYEKIVKAFKSFREWWDKYDHYGEYHEELVEWLHEDDNSESFINSYQDFVQLAELARLHDFYIPQIPDEKTFEASIQLRKAKKLQTEENTTIFPKDISLEERLAKSKKIHDFWMKFSNQDAGGIETVDGKQTDSGGQSRAGSSVDKKVTLSYLETINMAMDIFFSKMKRREKSTSDSPVSSAKTHAPANVIFEARKEIEKIASSRVPSLLDLFPVSDSTIPASELSFSLKKYLDLIRLSQEALTKFKNREMPFFDPLVGENSCQIRAAMFTEILNQPDIDAKVSSTLSRLTEHAEKIQDLLDKMPSKLDQNASFKSFLQQEKALFEISEEIAIIISSFILTETTVINYKQNESGVPLRKERIPPNIFSERKGLSTKFAKDLIKTTQKNLSKYSVMYVQRLAMKLLFSKEEKAAAIQAFKNVKTDKFNRRLVPFYPTMRLLLNEMYTNGTPLVLKIKQFVKGQSTPYGKVTLIFGNQGKINYSLLKDPSNLLKKGAVFFRAKSITDKQQSKNDLKEKILAHNVEDLILSASAAHPQFGCEDSVLDDPLFQTYRQNAHVWGTSLDNPSLFLVQHVCCETVEQKLIEALRS